MKPRKPSNQVDVPGSISVQEAGRRGGTATLENQGPDFFKRIGKKGGKRTKELYGELLSGFGKRGGRPRRPVLEGMGEESEKKEADAVGPGDSSPA